MEGRRTQLRGRSRDGHATKRTSVSIKKPRETAPRRASRAATLVTTIGMIVALAGAAGPAAADELV